MNILTFQVIAVVGLAPLCLGAEGVHAVHGTISRIDSAAKTIVVKATDGAEHTLHFAAKTTVHGAEAAAHGTEAAAKDTFHGLKEGTEVAHYTVKGSEETAVEVDKLGKDGMKAVEGTITDLD